MKPGGAHQIGTVRANSLFSTGNALKQQRYAEVDRHPEPGQSKLGSRPLPQAAPLTGLS